MARPKVFVSSTYYDLKHLRSSLENFIESLGFDPVLSEMGSIPYAPDMPLDESCYREASTSDIFVLILGGRYGSEASDEEPKEGRAFYDRYNSITKREYKSAISRGVPAYILIESNVYAEYKTFLKNRDRTDMKYAHVQSVNIFHLIGEILMQPRNNPVFTFERYSQIEPWLREQWAGLFRELLSRMSSQQQLAPLSSKVAELGEITITLRRYLETLIEKVSPKEYESIIGAESKRLVEARKRRAMSEYAGLESRVADYVMTIMEAIANESKDGPRLFTIEPVDGNWRQLTDKKYRIQLWCEAEGCQHPVREKGKGVYEFETPREWFKNIAPYTNFTAGVLRTLLPMAAPAVNVFFGDKTIDQLGIQNLLDLMKEATGKLLEGELQISDRPQLREGMLSEAERSGILALHALLRQQDPNHARLGLRRVQTYTGDYLWLCEKHYQEMQPKIPERIE